MTCDILASINITLPESIGLGTIAHVFVCLLVCLHVLDKPREARTSLLWILVAFVFPVAGALAYLLFGINTIPHKGWEKHYSDVAFRKHQRRESLSSDSPLAQTSATRDALRVAPADPLSQQLNRILERMAPDHPLLGGNSIEILEPAQSALEAMFDAVAGARQHIHLSTYIFNDDEVGKRLMALLIDRARAGVQVRVLYDAFGSAGASLRLFFWRQRHIRNLQLIGFSQANVLKRKFQLNLRNHRKILVVDGAVAFTGGVNFHDVYLPHGHAPGTIDYHFRLRGPIVHELQYTFLRDWYYMTDEAPERLLSHEHFPLPAHPGKSAARLQNSGPTQEETGAALGSFFAAINLAASQVLIVTPYFVPPESLILAMRQAAARGVDVKVLVPSINNHPTLQYASHALYEPLLASGVHIFERAAPFMHAKAAVIDGALAFIGSVNVDSRSLFMNYETNVVVFDQAFADGLKRVVHGDLSHAREIVHAEWSRRPHLQRFLENFFNLFHPIA